MATCIGRLLSVVVLMSAGCGGPGEAVGDDVCAATIGNYRVSYKMQSGDCAPISDFTVPMDGLDHLYNCSGQITHTPDRCRETWTNIVCPTDSSGGIQTTNATFVWNAAGSHGEGPMTITLSNAEQVLCSADYHASFDRF